MPIHLCWLKSEVAFRVLSIGSVFTPIIISSSLILRYVWLVFFCDKDLLITSTNKIAARSCVDCRNPATLCTSEFWPFMFLDMTSSSHLNLFYYIKSLNKAFDIKGKWNMGFVLNAISYIKYIIFTKLLIRLSKSDNITTPLPTMANRGCTLQFLGPLPCNWIVLVKDASSFCAKVQMLLLLNHSHSLTFLRK